MCCFVDILIINNFKLIIFHLKDSLKHDRYQIDTVRVCVCYQKVGWGGGGGGGGGTQTRNLCTFGKEPI